jgi:hypothetical protein
MADRPSHALCDQNVSTIATRLDLSETTADDGGPAMTLTSPMSSEPVGEMRRFERQGVATLVYVGIAVEAIGLDSHMLYAFTPAESAVPHFTLDSVQTQLPEDAGGGQIFAFHIDLNPRIDPGVNPEYLRHCYVPLDAARERGLAIDGVTAASLDPLQWQVMSAWMMANRATAQAFGQIGEVVAEYREHWFGLVEAGVPGSVLGGWDPERIAERDRASRDTIFSTEVDPVWNNISRLLGEEQATALRENVRDAGRDAR